eukprot:s4493_g6.t8
MSRRVIRATRTKAKNTVSPQEQEKKPRAHSPHQPKQEVDSKQTNLCEAAALPNPLRGRCHEHLSSASWRPCSSAAGGSEAGEARLARSQTCGLGHGPGKSGRFEQWRRPPSSSNSLLTSWSSNTLESFKKHWLGLPHPRVLQRFCSGQGQHDPAGGTPSFRICALFGWETSESAENSMLAVEARISSGKRKIQGSELRLAKEWLRDRCESSAYSACASLLLLANLLWTACALQVQGHLAAYELGLSPWSIDISADTWNTRLAVGDGGFASLVLMDFLLRAAILRRRFCWYHVHRWSRRRFNSPICNSW